MKNKHTGHRGSSASSKAYKKSPSSAAKKRAYDRAYSKKKYGSQAGDTAKKQQHNKDSAERWKARKKAGIAGKGGPDMSHTKSGRMVKEGRTKNRGRNGKNGRSTKK
jgi:hypothetical protein